MKRKKTGIIVSIIIVLIAAVIGFIYWYFADENRLTLREKEWISNHDSAINVAVINDVNNFGKDGEGIYFDFLEDLAEEYDFTINPVPFSNGSDPGGLSLSVKNKPLETDVILYEDHYVLVSKEAKALTSINSLNDKKIGVLTANKEHVNTYLSHSLQTFDTQTALFEALSNDQVNYVIVPLNISLDQILTEENHINYHFGDIVSYYTLSFVADDELTSVWTKFSNIWKEEKLEEKYNEYNLALFMDTLGIQEKDQDILTSKVYDYGLVKVAPFEVIMSNDYSGVISYYLNEFSKFSDVEFKYQDYKNVDKLQKAIKDSEIDLYFNYYNLPNSYTDIKTLYNAELVVMASLDNPITVNSLNSLKNKTIYVLENNNIHYYLKTLNLFKIEIIESESELLSLNNKNAIIILDEPSYQYYVNHGLENYTLRYSQVIGSQYSFKMNGDATFVKLFSNYIETIDPEKAQTEGLANYIETVDHGNIFSVLAKYALIIVGVGIICFVIYFKTRKKVKLKGKIRKDEKLRFIDMLTSLKNRNYLSENVSGWNNNTIYPQAAVVVDLNNIKYINDTYGSVEGDNQIKAAANVLIKTQLDNTDIIRTDGNEFLIYMIGYEEKRVISYIRKLYKEFNNLPYEYGASIGYSMRTDDLKTIDDAINEATLDMRSKKENRENSL